LAYLLSVIQLCNIIHSCKSVIIYDCGIAWCFIGIHHHFFLWLDWPERHSTGLMVLSCCLDTQLVGINKGTSGHCPQIPSWACYCVIWAALWIITIGVLSLGSFHLLVHAFWTICWRLL
jgi:hypothetical protein